MSALTAGKVAGTDCSNAKQYVNFHFNLMEFLGKCFLILIFSSTFLMILFCTNKGRRLALLGFVVWVGFFFFRLEMQCCVEALWKQ